MSGNRRYGFAKPHLVGLFTVVDGLGSCLAAIAGCLPLRSRPVGIHRILLVNFAHLGDVLMITPALRAVRAAYPEAHITVLVGPWGKDLLSANPYLDEVMVFRPSWWDREKGAYLRPAELVDLVRLLRQGRFDLSLNFKAFFQENLALWLAGVPRRVGYGIYGGGFLLTDRVEYEWGAHTVECNMALVDAVLVGAAPGRAAEVAPSSGGSHAYPGSLTDEGAREPSPLPSPFVKGEGGGSLSRPSAEGWERVRVRAARSIFRPGAAPAEAPGLKAEVAPHLSRRNLPEVFAFKEDLDAAEGFLAGELARGAEEGAALPRPLVAMHIGAGYPSKLWGEGKYAALANEIRSRWGASILIVGGADDLPLVARMQELSKPKLIVAAGRLGIRKTAALLSCCDLFVGNDSGPAHLAAATGVPTVAIFSGENEAGVWRPYADNCVVVQRHPDCAPCGKKRCDRDHVCMESITVDDVMVGIERILGQMGSVQDMDTRVDDINVGNKSKMGYPALY